MTKNQFLTDANLYINEIVGNAKSTESEKASELRFYSGIMYNLYEAGEISTLSPSKLTAADILGEKFELRAARRAFGQRLLKVGYSIEDVSTVMDHQNIKTARKYYVTFPEDDVIKNTS